MIYPKNFEQKIGFDEIRELLKARCLSTLGKERVDELAFSDDAASINEQMEQVREFHTLMQATEKPEMNYFFDVRESIARIRLENTHLEEDELWDLRRSLETISKLVTFLNEGQGARGKEQESSSSLDKSLAPCPLRLPCFAAYDGGRADIPCHDTAYRLHPR